MPIIKITNGDTDDWVKLSFPWSLKEAEAIKAFFKFSLSTEVYTLDYIRKCIYLRADILVKVKAGLEVLFSSALRGWTIKDEVIRVETFEEFFVEPDSISSPESRTKAELIQSFISIVQAIVECELQISDSDTISDLKPIYRQAAMVAHPDRNNGDGSRMSELNQIWAELQNVMKK